MQHLWRHALVKAISKKGSSGFSNKYENIWSLGPMVWLLVDSVCNSSLFGVGVSKLLDLFLWPYRKIAFSEGKDHRLVKIFLTFAGLWRGFKRKKSILYWPESLKSNICVNKRYSLVSKIRATLEVEAANYWIPSSHIFNTYTQLCLIWSSNHSKFKILWHQEALRRVKISSFIKKYIEVTAMMVADKPIWSRLLYD